MPWIKEKQETIVSWEKPEPIETRGNLYTWGGGGGGGGERREIERLNTGGGGYGAGELILSKLSKLFRPPNPSGN